MEIVDAKRTTTRDQSTKKSRHRLNIRREFVLIKGNFSQAETAPLAGAKIANITLLAPISIIVPTFKERENIPSLIDRVSSLRKNFGAEIELIFMDDKSGDGSVEAVAASGAEWASIIEREGERGLSPAVIEGFERARNPILVCMDCDLSHPPEAIPQMILALASGQELVLGSRYVKGGSTDDDWGFFRWLNSRIATLLAAPLTSARDPMSGFFAMRRSDFECAQDLNPIGYKVALELIVKCGVDSVGEIPIHFQDRVNGESKLTLREQLNYLKHIRRLYLYRFANAMYFIQFIIVGASGVVVNLTLLSLLLAMGASDAVSLAGGIALSVITNFLLNRRFTFSYARDRNPWKQFAGFITSSCLGMAVNYTVALWLSISIFTDHQNAIYLAALCGIAAGMTFNFLGNRFVVFRKERIRDKR
ncbi:MULTISPECIES: glycosyltransferase [unclassified Sulfitobacter]|uniref:glycosyltransferase n=1 Tax=unclassified Sulfitobacter TaxID=196795 RepID=UPI0009ECFD3F|nr:MULTISPECIES: glycosyltransferase family 2 protein [unclassified Sulfitobacter]